MIRRGAASRREASAISLGRSDGLFGNVEEIAGRERNLPSNRQLHQLFLRTSGDQPARAALGFEVTPFEHLAVTHADEPSDGARAAAFADHIVSYGGDFFIAHAPHYRFSKVCRQAEVSEIEIHGLHFSN
jgi:hypothetical protein